MRILNQPPGGRASFAQFPLPPYTSASPAPLTFLDVTTPPDPPPRGPSSSRPAIRTRRSTSRSSKWARPAPVPGGLTGTTIINADIENPPIENADIENADIENQEHTNADIENAAVRNADIENADIENADIENADIENADIENADIENADIENADIENADIENSSLTDVTWNVTNTGNTTTGFNVNLFLSQAAPPGVKLQLVLHKSYTTPAAVSCDLEAPVAARAGRQHPESGVRHAGRRASPIPTARWPPTRRSSSRRAKSGRSRSGSSIST